MNLRVAMLTDFPLRADAPTGGVEVVARNLAQLLGERKLVQLDIVTSRADVRRAYSTQLMDGVTIQYLPRMARFELPSLFLLDRLQLRRVLRDLAPDVVHVQGLGRYAFGALGRPYVLTIHGVTSAEHRMLRRGLGSRIQLGLHAHIESASVRQADTIIANSSYVAHRLPARLRSRTRLIPNPVDPHFFRDAPATPVAHRIIWVGRLHPLKGVDILIRALPRVRDVIPDAHVRLVGPIQNSAYVSQLRELIASLLPGGAVEFVGPLAGVDLRTEYSRAAVVAVPSLQENAPMCVLEAMAAARPVVASRIGGIGDMIDDDVTGAMCAPGSSTLLAEALVRVLRDEAVRSRLGHAARAKAERAFHPDTVVTSHAAVYHDVVERRLRAA